MIDQISILNSCLELVDEIRKKPRFSSEFQRWHANCSNAISSIFGSESAQLSEFKNISSKPKGSANVRGPESRFDLEYQKSLNESELLIKSLIADAKNLLNGLHNLSNEVERIMKICLRFHLVAEQITHRHNKRETLTIGDEYDVQDLMHALLKLDFEDIREEEWTPSYAGSASRVDFLMKREKIVVEVKKTRSGLDDKEIGNQLIIDIQKYKSHPDCHLLICFIYDPEHKIRNPRGLEDDLNNQGDTLPVKVIVAT